MMIEAFAESRRLKTRCDECGDKIIPGKRGHLYFDGGQLCLMVLDGAVSKLSSWEALAGQLWAGDISPHPKTGRRVQDVSVKGIPLENAQAAIRMIRARPVRILSPVEAAQRKQALAKAHARRGETPSISQKSIPGSGEDAEGQFSTAIDSSVREALLTGREDS